MDRFRKEFAGRRAQLAKDIIDEEALWLPLRDKGVLTEQHISDCKSKPTNIDRMSRMLELLERRPNKYFDSFCEALIEAGQEGIVEVYFPSYKPGSGGQASAQPVGLAVVTRSTGGSAYSDMLMTDQHKDLLRANRDKLVENMNPDALLNKLIATRVLNDEDKDTIKESTNRRKQAEALIDAILRKPDSAFQGLIDALNAGEQYHLARLLSG